MMGDVALIRLLVVWLECYKPCTFNTLIFKLELCFDEQLNLS